MARHTWTMVVGAVLLAGACGGDDGDDMGGEITGAVDDGGDDGMQSTGAPADDDGGSGSTGADDDAADSSGGAMACQTDVCATYGAAVPMVASTIVDMAAADPQFMEDFAPLVAQGDAAVMAFKDSLAAFISDAYGCTTGAYTGPTMEAAHAGLGITQGEYDAFIALIAGVLADAGVPEDDINQCFAPPLVDPAFVGTIVGQ